jgi:hypothetical protein
MIFTLSCYTADGILGFKIRQRPEPVAPNAGANLICEQWPCGDTLYDRIAGK